jgi:hypothetical protein
VNRGCGSVAGTDCHCFYVVSYFVSGLGIGGNS